MTKKRGGGAGPKYRTVLPHLADMVEKAPIGSRLPSVRQLMRTHGVSQAAIERCIDELIRRGLVRREPKRGIFVEGYVPKSNILGVYTDGYAAPAGTALFLQGIRDVAAEKGFLVADFGALDRREGSGDSLAFVDDGVVAGAVVQLSTEFVVRIQGSPALSESLRGLGVPLVTTHPLPAVRTDSVIADDFAALERVGAHLRARRVREVVFLGHSGLPSLARLYGLKAGLGVGVPVRAEIVDPASDGAFARLRAVARSAPDASLVIGVPPDEPGEAAGLRGFPWRAGAARELVVTLEANQSLPEGAKATVVVKPTYRLGRAAAEVLVRRLTRCRGEAVHRTVPYEIEFAGRRAAGGKRP